MERRVGVGKVAADQQRGRRSLACASIRVSIGWDLYACCVSTASSSFVPIDSFLPSSVMLDTTTLQCQLTMCLIRDCRPSATISPQIGHGVRSFGGGPGFILGGILKPCSAITASNSAFASVILLPSSFTLMS